MIGTKLRIGLPLKRGKMRLDWEELHSYTGILLNKDSKHMWKNVRR